MEIKVSESKVYEGSFQWPTKGEKISGLFTSVLTVFFWLLIFVDPTAVPLPVTFTLMILAAFFLGRKYVDPVLQMYIKIELKRDRHSLEHECQGLKHQK